MAFALAFRLTSCSSDSQSSNSNLFSFDNQLSDEKKLVGEWELESQAFSDGSSSNWKLKTIKIYEDGACSVEVEMGTWKIVDDKLMILGSYGGRF